MNINVVSYDMTQAKLRNISCVLCVFVGLLEFAVCVDFIRCL